MKILTTKKYKELLKKIEDLEHNAEYISQLAEHKEWILKNRIHDLEFESMEKQNAIIYMLNRTSKSVKIPMEKLLSSDYDLLYTDNADGTATLSTAKITIGRRTIS